MPDQKKYSKLSNARVLILGGTSGLGFAVAEAALEYGALQVTVSSHNPDNVANAVERLKSAYPTRILRINGLVCDLADSTSLESNIQNLLNAATNNGQKKLDHIVYTAGDPLITLELAEIDLPTIQQAGMVRFFSPIILAKLAPAVMNPGPRSSITLTSGTVCKRPIEHWAVAAGYTAGLLGLTRALAVDLKPIRVNVVVPGMVDTELWENMGMTPEIKNQILCSFAKKAPTGRVGRPEEVAEAYLYAMKNPNITGTEIGTDGGSMLV